MRQNQFLKLATAEEARDRFWQVIRPQPVGEEQIALQDALYRVLSRDVVSTLNIPFFDRSNFDGFAVPVDYPTRCTDDVASLVLELNADNRRKSGHSQESGLQLLQVEVPDGPGQAGLKGFLNDFQLLDHELPLLPVRGTHMYQGYC